MRPRRSSSRLAMVGALAVLAATVAGSAPAEATAATAATAPAVAGSAPAAASAAASQSSVSFFGTGSPGRVIQVPVRFAGRLIVRFHGDPATGCAAHGLCGYSGTVMWTPPSTGTLVIFESTAHGRTSSELSLSLFGGASIPPDPGGLVNAATQGPDQSCADAAFTGGSISLPLNRGAVRLNLVGASRSLLQTRCAGPLDADVASALPSPTATIQAVMNGRMAVDLSASRSFAGHGFAGAVTSTLRFRLGAPKRQQSTGSSGTGPTERYRFVRVDYRAAIGGTVIAAVSGDAAAGLCAPLGACGLHGTLSVRAGVSDAQAQFYAQAPAGRPYRDLLTALGIGTGGRASGVSVYGAASWTGGGTVTAALSDAAGSCRDATQMNGGLITFGSRGRRLAFQYTPGVTGDPTLRTRCPGPEGTQLSLASGSTPLSAMRARRVTLSLRHGGPFVDDGYTGRVTSTLRITLTRGRVHTGFINQPSG